MRIRRVFSGVDRYGGKRTYVHSFVLNLAVFWAFVGFRAGIRAYHRLPQVQKEGPGPPGRRTWATRPLDTRPSISFVSPRGLKPAARVWSVVTLGCGLILRGYVLRLGGLWAYNAWLAIWGGRASFQLEAAGK